MSILLYTTWTHNTLKHKTEYTFGDYFSIYKSDYIHAEFSQSQHKFANNIATVISLVIYFHSQTSGVI